MKDKPLAGKCALISGAANPRGFGLAIARRLAQAGADLLLTDVVPCGVGGAGDAQKRPGLEHAVDEIRQMGQRADYALADVRCQESVQAAVDRALETFGRLDILVNNAAAPPAADRVPLVELTEDAWNVVLDTNLKGAFLLTRVAAVAMIRQGSGGRIINISSTTGKIPYSRMAAYSASKAGLLGLSRATALELAPEGITVNAVCPGVSDTNRIDYLGSLPGGGFDRDLRSTKLAQRAEGIPLGRVAVPEDVAAVVAFLASDEAGYLTGEFINIAGGYVMD